MNLHYYRCTNIKKVTVAYAEYDHSRGIVAFRGKLPLAIQKNYNMEYLGHWTPERLEEFNHRKIKGTPVKSGRGPTSESAGGRF